MFRNWIVWISNRPGDRLKIDSTPVGHSLLKWPLVLLTTVNESILIHAPLVFNRISADPPAALRSKQFHFETYLCVRNNPRAGPYGILGFEAMDVTYMVW